MKKTILLILLIGFNALGGELLKNTAFEKSDKGRISSWQDELVKSWTVCYNGGRKKGRAELIENDYNGKNSVSLAITAPTGFMSMDYNNLIPVSPGQSVTVSFWAIGTGKAYIRLYFCNAAGKRIGKKHYFMQGLRVKPDKWNQYIGKFEVPKNVAALHFSLQTLKVRPSKIKYKVNFAAPSVSIKNAPVLENAALRLRINTRCGGGLDSFLVKSCGKDFTRINTPAVNGGMFCNIIPAIRLPGIFRNESFKLERPAPNTFRLSALATDGKLAGLELVKEYSLDAKRPELTVNLKLVNHSKRTLKFDQRLQSFVSGAPGIFSWPFSDWLSTFRISGKSLGGKNSIIQKSLRAGWVARFYEQERLTLLFKFDVKAVEKCYNYFKSEFNTVEWYYQECTLMPGQTWSSQVKVAVLEKQTGRYCDQMGAKQQEVEIPAVKMPPPPSGKPLPASLSEYFPYVANLGNLGNMLPEMAGIHGSRSQLWAHTALKLARLQTDAYFNGFFAGHTAIVPETCRQLQLKDGKNALGEFARRYDLRLFPNYIFLIRPDIDPSKFMKNKWPKVSAHLANPCIKKFLSQYHDLMPAFFTADEIMGQNADVMLRVHKELKKIIPQGIETFPYLRSADNDLMPYLPVFLGDFYPIKRHDFSGRNPWAVEREFAPLVKKAGDQPVWFMPQGFGSAPERGYCLPTAGEIRLMLNIAIGTGVRGIIWYGFPCGTLAWELNYSSCYYSLLGSGGQTGKGWNAVIEIGRNLAGLGPLLCRSRPAGLPKDICLKCRNFKDPLFYNGPAIKLYPLRTPQGKLIIAVNQNPRAPEKGTLKLPEGKWFDFSNLKPVNSQTVKLELPAGGARYLYNGSNAEINLVFKSRLHREIKRYLLQEALLTANGLNGLNLTGLEKLPPRQGLAEFQRRRTRLDREIANSAAGKMLRLLEQTKQNIDKLDFLFATHMKTLVTPEMRRATPRYRRWAKNPDQELQQARETLRNLFYEYNRLNDKLWNGSASAADMLSKAKTLKKNSETAHSNIQALLNRKSKAEDVDNPLI